LSRIKLLLLFASDAVTFNIGRGHALTTRIEYLEVQVRPLRCGPQLEPVAIYSGYEYGNVAPDRLIVERAPVPRVAAP
jgi:hypothetical protein